MPDRPRRDQPRSTPPQPQGGPFGSTLPGGVARPAEPPSADREPTPHRRTIARQNQHVDRCQDGGREGDRGRIEKHGGDVQRDDVERH